MNNQTRRLASMLRRWTGGASSDRELDAELELFLQHDIDDRIASGMAAGEARRTALAANRLRAAIGLPQSIVLDNGPEFAGRTLGAWV